MAPIHPPDKRFGMQPALGRDIPYSFSPDGVPLPDLEYRLVDYGEGPWGGNGLRHETKCPHCGEWLSYGDKGEAASIYLRCEDHRNWQNGPFSW